MNEEINKKNSLEPDVELKRLRTYEEDLQAAISNDGITTAKIVMAEQAKREAQQLDTPTEKPQFKPKKASNLIPIAISIVLFSAASLFIYLNFDSLKPLVSNFGGNLNNGINQTIVPNTKITIDSIGKTKGAIIRQIQEIISSRTVGNQNEIVEIEILKDIEVLNEKGFLTTQKTPINSSDFFNLIDSRAPDNLIRSLKGELIIGLHKLDKLEPFIILKSEDIAQTYSGMLTWESNMGADVTGIFFENLIPTETTVQRNDTANSTQPDSLNPSDSSFNIRNFVDRIILNKDTRAIVNNRGDILFFYSLIDNENIIMTTNRETLSVLLNRINQVNLIR